MENRSRKVKHQANHPQVPWSPNTALHTQETWKWRPLPVGHPYYSSTIIKDKARKPLTRCFSLQSLLKLGALSSLKVRRIWGRSQESDPILIKNNQKFNFVRLSKHINFGSLFSDIKLTRFFPFLWAILEARYQKCLLRTG